MAEDHRNRSVGNPNTAHGGHEPTPLENWNRYKTRAEKSKERDRAIENEVRANGGNVNGLASPYLDPYDYEEPDQSWRTITIDTRSK